MATQTKEQKLKFITNDILKETRKRLEQSQKRSRLKDLINRAPSELFTENGQKSIQSRMEKTEAFPKGQTRGIPSDNLLDDPTLERILGSNDLLNIRFLLEGAELSASVGRINLPGGFATGFLVAPGILMTNWHVFQVSRAARNSTIEFGFRELEGGERTTPTIYALDPNKLFFSDKDLDVAVVAMGNRTSGQLNIDDLPFSPLLNEEDAVLNGDRLNIIQHPAGQPKQIALRDNTVFAIPDETFLQYRADTRRGSSGSPVFNDEWEVVGLHHSGVPNRNSAGDILALDGSIWNRSMGDDQIDWLANEAIQSSALIRLLNTLRFEGVAGDLLDRVLNPPRESFMPRPNTFASRPVRKKGKASSVSTVENGIAKITIPIEVSVRIADLPIGTVANNSFGSLADLTKSELEEIGIDPDYENRSGYDEEFLDEPIPMPGLTEEQQMSAAVNREAPSEDKKFILDYHNFSLIMNAERRLSYFTAVNIDGEKLIRISRNSLGGTASWITDRRIGLHEQADNVFYRGRTNRLDRGHLVRRLDPGWGDTREDSARGIVDTFHYTNSSPQYDRFNRTDGADGLWLGLENFVLNNSEMDDLKVSVFSGPVFRDDDPDFKNNGLKIPRQYWKIIAWCESGELQTAAFLLSQESLLDGDVRIEDLPQEAFDFRSRTLFQTTVEEIAELTMLEFGPLLDNSNESTSEAFEIRSEDDIIV